MSCLSKSPFKTIVNNGVTTIVQSSTFGAVGATILRVAAMDSLSVDSLTVTTVN